MPGLSLAQQDDRSFLTALLEDNLSGAGRKVTITGFAGALSSRASIVQLTIADDEGVWLTLTDVALDWSRASLLSGAVVVNSLTAAEIVLDRVPSGDGGMPSAEAMPFALPDLPVSVSIGEISAEKIVLGEAVLGEAVEARVTAALQLAAGEGNTSFVLERTDGKEARIALTASYANATQNLLIDLEAVEAADGLTVRRLGIPGAPSAALTVKGSGPIRDFAADVALQTDGVDRLAGTVTLNDDGAGTAGFRADLSGDLAPVFLPQYAEFFGPQVRLVAAGSRDPLGRLALRDLRVTANALDLSGQVDLAPDGLPERIDIAGTLGLADGTPLLLPLGGGVETRVTGAAIVLRYDAADGEGWSGDADLTGFDRADFKAETLRLAGSGRISRAGEAPVIGGTLRFAAQGLAPADPALAEALGSEVTGTALGSWEAGTGVTRLSRLQIAGTDYAATLRGSVAGLDTGFNLSGVAEATFDNLSRFSALAGRPLGGSGTATMSGTGSPLSGQFDVDAKVSGTDLRSGLPPLDNLMRGLAVVEASVRRDETGTTLRSARLAAGSLTISASGRLATGGNAIAAEVDFRDLAVLGDGYRGALAGQVTLNGDRVTLDVRGQDLAIGQGQADRLLAGESVVSGAAILGETVVVERFDIRNPQVTASGTGRFGQTRTADAEVRLADLSVLGRGYGGSLTGTFGVQGDRLTIEAVGQGLAIGQAEADRLLRGTSRVSAELTLTSNGVVIDRADVTNPQITASASGGVDGAQRRLALQARLANLAVILPDFPGALTVSGTAVDEGAGYLVDLRGTGPGQIDATVKGQINSSGTADLAIAGTAQAALANAFVGPRAVAGAVRFDLALRGPLAAGSLGGTISLNNGRIADPSLNFALEGVAAQATLSGGTARIEAVAGVTSGGTVSLRGSVGLAAPHTGDLAVELARVQLRDPDLYETTVDGAVTVTGPLTGGALIAGRLTLDATELRIPSTGFGGSGDLPGLLHLREPADVRNTRARAGLLGDGSPGGGGNSRAAAAFGLNILISAPNRVFVRGRGLDVELGGQLTLTGTTAAIVPFGALDLIRGRLDILGRRLDLTEASLQMEGALVPYLDVKAANEGDGFVTSVEIEGPANDPVVRFTSSPDLPEEEVLARLLFGQGLENLSAFQAAQLAGAVASLAGRGGGGLISRLRQGIGLDNLDVQTDSAGGTSITAGKYLTERIYTEVTVDDEGKSRIDLNLDIARHITLRAGSDSEGSTGVGIYLEKDY